MLGAELGFGEVAVEEVLTGVLLTLPQLKYIDVGRIVPRDHDDNVSKKLRKAIGTLPDLKSLSGICFDYTLPNATPPDNT